MTIQKVLGKIYTCITIREISQQWCCIYITHKRNPGMANEILVGVAHVILLGMAVIHMQSR